MCLFLLNRALQLVRNYTEDVGRQDVLALSRSLGVRDDCSRTRASQPLDTFVDAQNAAREHVLEDIKWVRVLNLVSKPSCKYIL